MKAMKAQKKGKGRREISKAEFERIATDVVARYPTINATLKKFEDAENQKKGKRK